VTNTLKLQVEVETKGTDKLSSLGGNLQRTGLNLTKFVTAPLLGAGAAAIALAADAEKSATKLNAAYKNMGSKSGKTLDQLTAQATELGEATTFDDEGIMEAQATLLSFGVVAGEAFDRTIVAATDLAAATGKDLPTATALLGKALADPAAAAGKLAKAGVVLTEQQEKQIAAFEEAGDKAAAQGVILEALEGRYKGVNEALSNTAAGETAQAFEDLANAGEAIGAIFLPILADLAKGLQTVAQFFTSLSPEVQRFIVIIAGVVAAVGPTIFVIGKLVTAFKGVILVFNLLKIALLTNPFTALAVAVAAIAALIILNWDKISAFLKATWAAITKALGGVVKFFTDAWEGLLKVTTAVWDSIAGIIKGAINGVIDVINGLFSFLNGIQIGIPEVNVGPVHIGGGVIDPFNIGLIPHLAEGGIIDSPTLALLGEAGPEAVVPLSAGPIGETHFHSHIEVKGEDPFIRNEADLIRANKRVAFLAGF